MTTELGWHHILQARRGPLLALAYKMTGSRQDAEDILQTAWLKCHAVPIGQIRHPERWLTVLVARACLDQLRRAKTERVAYVGPWLPEPLLDAPPDQPEAAWIRSEDLGTGLILMLQGLSAQMRAAFLLHHAFDYSHTEVAEALQISPSNSRQLIARARKRMQNAAPPSVDAAMARSLAQAFWRASRDGDIAALMQLFAPDVEVHTDGGGVVYAALNVISGADKASRLFAGLAEKRRSKGQPAPPVLRINGAQGFVSCEEGVLQTTALQVDAHGRITAVWICRNPQKLQHVTL